MILTYADRKNKKKLTHRHCELHDRASTVPYSSRWLLSVYSTSRHADRDSETRKRHDKSGIGYNIIS